MKLRNAMPREPRLLGSCDGKFSRGEVYQCSWCSQGWLRGAPGDGRPLPPLPLTSTVSFERTLIKIQPENYVQNSRSITRDCLVWVEQNAAQTLNIYIFSTRMLSVQKQMWYNTACDVACPLLYTFIAILCNLATSIVNVCLALFSFNCSGLYFFVCNSVNALGTDTNYLPQLLLCHTVYWWYQPCNTLCSMERCSSVISYRIIMNSSKSHFITHVC